MRSFFISRLLWQGMDCMVDFVHLAGVNEVMSSHEIFQKKILVDVEVMTGVRSDDRKIEEAQGISKIGPSISRIDLIPISTEVVHQRVVGVMSTESLEPPHPKT